jgi:hypothetical protein
LIVKIFTQFKEWIISNANVERYIDLQSGIPFSMIRLLYDGKIITDLSKAFVEETSLSLECEIIKTDVIINSVSEHKGDRIEYIFQEKISRVPCNYKILSFDQKFSNEKAILIPEDVRELPISQMHLLRDLPFIRLILRQDIPRGYLLPFPRYKE